MRPLLLDLENIGPFVGRTTVDFRLFDDSSLFLITGKTGSGKSFLFDSMCYALYGQTPSGREDNLSSDFSKTGDRPRILFRFSIGQDLYEVERNLPYEDAKHRGSGTKVRPESQTLRRMTPVTEVLATKKTEVNKGCEELLQLKMDQFSRVIMIPQGEFRELLRSNTEDREKLLRQLFRSFPYLDLARALEEEYKAQNGKYLDMKKETGVVLDQLLKRLPQEGIPQEDGVGVEAILEHRKRIEGSIPSLRESIDMLFRQYEGSREVSRWMDDVMRLHRTKGELSSEFERYVRTGASDIDPFREKVRRHDLASDFVPLLNVISERTSRMARLEGSLTQMVTDLGTRDLALSALKKEMDKLPLLKARYELILSNQGRLSTLQADIDRSKELSRAFLKRSREEKRLNDMLSGIASRSQKLVSELERIKKDIAERSEPITDIEKAKSKQVVVLDLIEVMKDRSLQVPVLERDRQLISAMVERSDLLQRKHIELRRAREGSLAYELASGMVVGKPCPVCGSLDHPTPAAIPAMVVKKEEVDSAEEAYLRSLSELDSLKASGLKVQTNIEGYDRRIAQMMGTYPELTGLDIQDLTSVQDLLDKGMRREKKRTSELDVLQKVLLENNAVQSAITEERSGVLTSLEAVRVEMNACREQLAEVEARSERDRTELSTLVPGESDLTAIVKRLNEEKDSLPLYISRLEKEYKEASDSVLDLSSRVSQIRSELNDARLGLNDLGTQLSLKLSEPSYSSFVDRADIESSILGPDHLKVAKDRISEYDRVLSELRGRMEQTERDLSDRLEGRSMPTPEDQQVQVSDEKVKKDRLEEEKARLSSLEHEVREIARSFTRIEGISKAMSEMEPDLAMLRDLSEQVKGNGRPKISLERFFLAQRFEEVLIEANTRLNKLSEGRFYLKRTDEKETGGLSKSGLDITVNDSLTGQDRPASTLSGGQMFLTSLALALGLADVVQARSGGIHMDALFIDEGFGSLDDETLQLALKVLSELRRGRMVGVISHVQELKRQIPQRIEVVPDNIGSRINMVT